MATQKDSIEALAEKANQEELRRKKSRKNIPLTESNHQEVPKFSDGEFKTSTIDAKGMLVFERI